MHYHPRTPSAAIWLIAGALRPSYVLALDAISEMLRQGEPAR